MTFGHLAAVVRHHWIVVVTLTAAVVIGVAVLESSSTPQYRASALLQVQAPTDSSGIISLQGTLSARERAVTITALGNTADVARRAWLTLGGVRGLGNCSFAQSGQSEYLQATCTGTVPRSAARGANAYAAALQALLEQQRLTRVAELRSSYSALLRTLRKEGVPATDFPQPPAYPTYRELQVIDSAQAPTTAYAPRTLRAVLLALALGLILNIGIAFLLDRVQNRARTPEDLRRALGEPVLVAIPKLRAAATAHATNPIERRERASAGSRT